ncbi:hypothetical protein LZ30DRAFT_590681 [Colletotrichum cereale]|nr:hypothetical protein LZ30DRAFT_590681 [Colletotrichum cereale]
MDQNQDNEGIQEGDQEGGQEDSNKVVNNTINSGGNKVDNNGGRKKKRNRKSRDCCNCRKGLYLAAGALTDGIKKAIEDCPVDNPARLGQLMILQRINHHRLDGGDLTRRTQAAILNDLSEVHERMPGDQEIVGLGDRCHNHLWYSALIRRDMVIPAEWQAKPHVAVRLEKLRAVWEAVKKTPNLRKRSAKPQAAGNQPAVDEDENDKNGEEIECDEEIEDDEDVVDDEHQGLQQPRTQNAFPARVPRVNQPQSSRMMPLAGYANNSMGQNYGQLPPEIAYGSRFPMHHPMLNGNPTPQLGNMGLQSSLYSGYPGGFGQNHQQLYAMNQGYPPQQFANGGLLSNSYGSVSGFAFSHNQVPGSGNTAYGGSGAAPFSLAGGIFSQASACHAFQHGMHQMNDANQQFGLANFNDTEPVSFGNLQHPRLPFGRSTQTFLQTRPGALDGNDSSAVMAAYAKTLEKLFNRQMKAIQADPLANGMANVSDMETGPDADSRSSADDTHDTAGAADASTSSDHGESRYY